MQGERVNLPEWLGLDQPPNFQNGRKFGRFLGFAVVLLLGLFIFAILGVFANLIMIAFFEDGVVSKNIRDYGLVLAAMIGAPFLIWRTIVAAKQADIAEEALLNDKFNSAAQDLSARYKLDTFDESNPTAAVVEYSKDDLVARMAAINRLESLTEERPDIAPRVAKTLAAYVRGTFPCANLNVTEPPFPNKIPRLDLQAAIDAIGRVLIIAREVDPSEWRVDLRRCDLDGVNFSSGYFYAADFTFSRFEGCLFTESNLEGTRFTKCLLNFAHFREANLRGANFDYGIINRPRPGAGSFNPQLQQVADLTGISVIGSDLTALDYLWSADDVAKTLGSNDTKLSEDVEDQLPPLKERRKVHSYLQKANPLPEGLHEVMTEIDKIGFRSWVPYDSNDLEVGKAIRPFFERLDMYRWPYVDLLKRFR